MLNDRISINGTRQANPQRQKVDSQLPGRGEWRRRVTGSKYRAFLRGGGDENVLKLDTMSFAQL